MQEAETCYRQALQLRPQYAEALTNLGLVLAEQARLEEAEQCHSRALQIRPGFAEAHRNRSLVRLLTGNLRQGWEDYEWRWRCADFSPPGLRQPQWDGGPLRRRTILLYSEQGYGDTFQFVRYGSLLQQHGARVILVTRDELIPLLTSCPAVDQLFSPGERLPRFDVHLPLLSLPHTCGTTLETIPADVPYLYADPHLARHWRWQLQPLDGLKVGICWQGSSTNRYYRTHGIPLGCFELLARLPGVHLISLQKIQQHDCPAQATFPLHDFTSQMDEHTGAFMDTAAVIANLDLVITFDTSIGHLAGAMGKPVWIALPYVPEWRWLLDRDDSPWYPTARLFRQPEPGNWDAPFAAIQEALQSTLRCRTGEVPHVAGP